VVDAACAKVGEHRGVRDDKVSHLRLLLLPLGLVGLCLKNGLSRCKKFS
jgi:hypothetical protein